MWLSRIVGQLAGSECELLYGRAGYLYSLAWLQQQLGRQAVSEDLMAVSRRQQQWGRWKSRLLAWQFAHLMQPPGAAHS